MQKSQCTEMGVLPDFKYDGNRRYGNHPQIKLPNKTKCIKAQWGPKQPTSFMRQDPPDDRILYPTTDRVRRAGGKNNMTIDPQSSQTKEELINISAASIDCNITTVLARLMASDDKKIKALGKRLFTEAVLPAANPGVSNMQKPRTRSLATVEQLTSPKLHYPVYGHVDREYKQSQLQPDDNINDDYSPDGSPSLLLSDEEEHSNENFEFFRKAPTGSQDKNSEKIMTELQSEHEIQEVLEYSKLYLEKTLRKSAIFCEKLKNMPSLSETLNKISSTKNVSLRSGCTTPNGSIYSITESSLEGEEETALQTLENEIPDSHEEELGMISRVIDEFEQKINETRTKIRQLRRESVNMLTKEMSNSSSEKNSETDIVPEALSYLEIEQMISQLEDESHELEIKRREALSSLQKKMLVNIMNTEQKQLLPLVPIPMPKRISASMGYEHQNLTSSEVSASNSSRFSRRSQSSEAEASNVKESSTQREELCDTKEEKPNEN